MFAKKLILMSAALLMFAPAAGAQDQPEKVIKHVPIKATSAASGKEMYTSYCAVCHGTDGKGGGPAAGALKAPPADLSVLSKNSGGKFPSMKVASAIRGDVNVPAHGSKDMPMWGQLFSTMSSGHQAEVQQRVVNLSSYIESLQAK